jgi:hypothetical protein
MYTDTITVFNRKDSRLGDTWYPTILRNVNLNIDRAAIAKVYGAESADTCLLGIKYVALNGEKYIGQKRYLLPKEWDSQVRDELAETITFTAGEGFDFFIEGEYDETPVNDDDYTEGFFEYMKRNYDRVYSITSVSEFSVIPHIEITGK